MNDLINALILAVVQGLTEWLPVSSSGHLVLFQEILDYHPGLSFDVALHFGTLMAVFVYFGKDIMDIIECMLKRDFKSENGKLGILLIISSIPAAAIGYFLNDFFESAFSSLLITTMGFGITGLVLLIASLEYKQNKRENPSYKDSILIGCAQAFAILPGVSRSGSTISAGLLLGLNEKSAMKFSFLMSIPVIFGAGALEIGNKTLPVEMLWATLVSFVVGLLTIWLLLKFVSKSRKNLRWFAGYALLLFVTLVIYSLF
jgi:undecaprenyl-diphosphatase